jgi:DNA-binding response OmpR family regulator
MRISHRMRQRNSGGMVILLAEADINRSRVVLGWLNSERRRVRWVHDGGSALTELHRIAVEVLIIASRLPVLDAVEVCRRVRCWSNLPIIVLGSDCGIDADVDACIAALEAGADDYIKPPVHEHEFMARVHAATRRSGRS